MTNNNNNKFDEHVEKLVTGPMNNTKERVMEFLHNYNDFDYTVREIADATNIHSRIVKTILNELMEKGVVVTVRIRRHATTIGGATSASSNVYSYQIKEWMTVASRQKTADWLNQKMVVEQNKNRIFNKKVSGFP